MLEQLQTPDILSEANIIAETKKELGLLKQEIIENDPKKIDLKKKPINLWYKEINKEKKITINLPDAYSAQWRILRCMRWKSMTDAVEDKYDIPRWLLLAMMAQEGMGDPTMPNLGWDWWLWLIHIQGKNAADYWLKTLPRYNEGMRDLKHGEEINKAKKENGDDVKKLIKVDDRFHPLMGLDCSARFLKDVYNRTDAWPDRRINALKKYSGRPTLNEYVRPVVKYWLLVNEYTWDSLPNFTTSTNKEIQKMRDAKQITLSWVTVPLDIVKTSSEKLSITLDWKPASYEQYLSYFNQQAVNYWLNDYKKLSEESNVFTKPEALATVSPKKLWEKDPTRKETKDLKYLNKSKDKEWFVYKYTIPSDITSVLDLTTLFSVFAWTTFQVTNETWDELKRPNIPSKKWEHFYIKEKIV